MNLLSVTPDSWPRVVLGAKLPVLVDFWASWCAPCRAMTPDLETVARELAGKAAVVKLSVEEHPEFASQFGVQNLPTLLLFRNGRVVEQAVGRQSLAALRKLLTPSPAQR